jgi:hypothetical protein
MKIGFVVPGSGADDEAPCRALIDGVGDVAERLRQLGNEVVVAELAPSWWMLPPSTFVERALCLVDRFADFDAVVDQTGSWTGLLRRQACPFPVLTARRPAATPLDDAGRRPLLEEAALPAIDPERYEVGHGAAGYVVGALRAEERQALADLAVVPLAGEAERPERAALLADAAAFVAPPGPAGAWAAVEALACGTPVVAWSGSPAAEVVTEGVTGVVVDRPGTLGKAIAAAADLDRWACRHAACERFSVERRAHDVVAAVRAQDKLTALPGGPDPTDEARTAEARAASAPGQEMTGAAHEDLVATGDRPASRHRPRPAPACVGSRVLTTASR